MEHFGQVMELKDDKRALVKIRQHLSCGSCGRCAGFFGDPEKNNIFLVEVLNPIGAKKGELVRLETRSSEVILAACLLYLLPLAGLLVGILAGRSWAVSRALAGSPDLWGLGIGFLFMAGVFFLLRLYEKNLKRGKRFKATITSVVDENEIPEDLVPAE
ncbi:MAG TPA: SoxR reducing system RseC family protein [Firmicutes bacterium]|nr:SoxR reducing system RseC family protein [Bacillota bacterium]